jgi:type I restriction enzyme S subunit
MLENAKSSAGQQGVSGEDVKGQPFALPPTEEQAEIVRIVQKMFALADRIEARLTAATFRAEKLPQSILSKAFKGELVPTEAELARAEGRSFESAEEMLKRVRAGNGSDGDGASKKRAGSKGRRATP